MRIGWQWSIINVRRPAHTTAKRPDRKTSRAAPRGSLFTGLNQTQAEDLASRRTPAASIRQARSYSRRQDWVRKEFDFPCLDNTYGQGVDHHRSAARTS